MSLSSDEVASLLLALSLLLIAAHGTGHLFARLRQPPVIGEILGGLLLGPTVLGAVAPGVQSALFPTGGATATVLGAVHQLGLLLLMFLAGQELRTTAAAGERKTVAWVATVGIVLPLGIGIAAALPLDAGRYSGPAGSATTFTLVFGIAIAVTSIPVISRIMLDLGILQTSFARIVLSVAVLEDVVLYVLLALTLGLADANEADPGGLAGLLGTDSPVATGAGYVLGASVFLGLFLLWGSRLYAAAAGHRANLLARRDPTAFQLVFLLLAASACVLLSVNPVFGALAAGFSVARGTGPTAAADRESRDSLRRFSLAFFIPVYFAVVGLSLDLQRDLDPAFLAGFLVLASLAKGVSVWVGARLSGQDRATSVDLAMALNARGGPGIVLASVTLSAGIISRSFFTTLVLLSVLTSQFAGNWLHHTRGRPARPGVPAAPADLP